MAIAANITTNFGPSTQEGLSEEGEQVLYIDAGDDGNGNTLFALQINGAGPFAAKEILLGIAADGSMITGIDAGTA